MTSRHAPRTIPTAPRRHRVVAVAYDRLCTFEFGCVVEFFALSRPELGVDWYRFDVCAAEPGPLRAEGGITIDVPHGLGLLDRADTIVIPGWRDVDEPPPRALVERLRRAHARGARFCTICSGVFVLAAAGLADGRRVTTHWRYAERLAGRYPKAQVAADALYVADGPILTSAGSAAGLDLLIDVVRNDYGAAIANRVAQRLVIAPHRQGGQAQFVPRPVADDADAALAPLLDWIRAHLAEAHSIASLARRWATSARTLQRRFVDATGMAVYEWLVRERVAAAKDLLESPRLSMGRIAERVGFRSDESFRRHFRRVTGVSPSAYRRSFAVPAVRRSRARARDDEGMTRTATTPSRRVRAKPGKPSPR